MRREAELAGRRAECGVLDRLAEAVRPARAGRWWCTARRAWARRPCWSTWPGTRPGCRVTRASGVQSEMELAFAGLHQLCAPMLDRLDTLPAPQRDALRTAFGMSAGPAPDRFLIGLAVLSLLSHVAAEQPLVCLVDDQQWLDRASAQILAFAARRLGAESVGLVFATRNPGGDLAGLPELAVAGLREADARALLDAALTGPIDARVRDQIIAETRGNPLALLELPRGLTPGGAGRRLRAPRRACRWRAASRRASGGGSARSAARPGGCCCSRRRTRPATRRWCGGRPPSSGSVPMRRCPRPRPGWPSSAPGCCSAIRWPARRPTGQRPPRTGRRRTGLWPRPPIRSSIPTGAPGTGRRPPPGRMRTSPRSLNARPAGRSARGGLAAAAAFLKQAATLTLDPARRAGRALAAAQAKIQAGAFDAALDLLAVAEAGPLSDLQQAHADLARAQLAFVTSRGTEAPPLLLKAARRLEPSTPGCPARPTWTRCPPRSSPAGWPAPAATSWQVARAAAEAPPAAATAGTGPAA